MTPAIDPNAPWTVAAAVIVGAGATLLMDLWAALLWRGWRVASLDYALLGRWIGHFPAGRFRHANIARAAPVAHERAIGRTAHYAIGIAFAVLLVGVAGPEWLKHPTLLPALLVSSATLAAPMLVMQPAFGLGVAASRTPRPNLARLRSTATHTVYGIGLYATAWLLALATR
jgi:hypothetical protein